MEEGGPEAAAGREGGGATLTGARVLLLIPARSYRAADFLAAANRLRLDLIIGSDGVLPLGGHPIVHVHAGDVDDGADRLIDRVGPVDAVIAADTPMLTLAAATAARMGLPTNPVAAVRAATDKGIQRQLWAAAGVAQPAFRVVPAGAPEPVLRRAAADVGFPCVVKAVSLSASQGVLRADAGAEAVAAASWIRRVLAGAGRLDPEPIVIEEYIAGSELSIDGLLDDGELTVTGVFDKPESPEGPTFEETLLVTPSRLRQSTLTAARSVAAQAAVALGLRYGPIHAELRMDRRSGWETPRMLELAARSIGGLCSRALRYIDGVSLEEMLFANALRQHVSPARTVRPSGVLMLPVERSGVLRAVEGTAAARDVPGITGLSITIPVGQVVRCLPEGDRYLGFVLAEGETHEEVEHALCAARRQLSVVID